MSILAAALAILAGCAVSYFGHDESTMGAKHGQLAQDVILNLVFLTSGAVMSAFRKRCPANLRHSKSESLTFAEIAKPGLETPAPPGCPTLSSAQTLKSPTTTFTESIDTCAKEGVHLGNLGLVREHLLLGFYAEEGDVDEAEQQLQCMLKHGIPANTVSYDSLILACARVGRISRAEFWLEHMLKVGLQASVATYNAVLDACAKSGDFAHAENWLNRMATAGVQANEVSYSTVIHACAKAGHVDLAKTWLKKMSAAGIEANFDVLTCNGMISDEPTNIKS